MSQSRQFAPAPAGRTWRGLVIGIAVLALTGAAAVALAQDQPPAAPSSPYIGAEACKTCHAAIYDSWSKTKHARAASRVRSDEDRASGKCMGCHATGSAEQIAREKAEPSLPGVQCECCHGPARAHASSEPGKPVFTGLTRHPQAGDCERCHNSQSPHFQGFVFSGMKLLVHAKGK